LDSTGSYRVELDKSSDQLSKRRTSIIYLIEDKGDSYDEKLIIWLKKKFKIC